MGPVGTGWTGAPRLVIEWLGSTPTLAQRAAARSAAVALPARGRRPARSGRRLLPQLLGQPADLRLRVAAVPAQRPHEGQPALLGPAGDGLGRHMQNLGHLGGPQIAGRLHARGALALSCHRASFLEPEPDSPAGARTGCPSDHDREDVRRRRSCRSPAGAGPTGRLSRLVQAATIARLGCFSSVCYLGTEAAKIVLPSQAGGMLRATKAVAAGCMVGGLDPAQPADAPPPPAGPCRPIAPSHRA